MRPSERGVSVSGAGGSHHGVQSAIVDGERTPSLRADCTRRLRSLLEVMGSEQMVLLDGLEKADGRLLAFRLHIVQVFMNTNADLWRDVEAEAVADSVRSPQEFGARKRALLATVESAIVRQSRVGELLRGCARLEQQRGIYNDHVALYRAIRDTAPPRTRIVMTQYERDMRDYDSCIVGAMALPYTCGLMEIYRDRFPKYQETAAALLANPQDSTLQQSLYDQQDDLRRALREPSSPSTTSPGAPQINELDASSINLPAAPETSL